MITIRTRRGVDLGVVKELSISLTAADLARAFCEMDGDQQATFFAEVERVMQSWNNGASASMQRHCIAASIKAHGMTGAKHWLEDIASALEGE